MISDFRCRYNLGDLFQFQMPFVVAALAAATVIAISGVITVLVASEQRATIRADVTARADGLLGTCRTSLRRSRLRPRHWLRSSS